MDSGGNFFNELNFSWLEGEAVSFGSIPDPALASALNHKLLKHDINESAATMYSNRQAYAPTPHSYIPNTTLSATINLDEVGVHSNNSLQRQLTNLRR